MHGILAGSGEVEAGLFALAMMCVGIIIAIVALVAIFYAARDERQRAVKLTVPAVIWVALFTTLLGYEYIKVGLPNPDCEVGHDFIMPWIAMAGLPFVTSMIVILVLWFKSERITSKTRKKIIFAAIYVFLLLFFLWHILFMPLIDRAIPGYRDVAKRIKSPDGTKTALLVRRNARQLSFAVQKEGFINRTLLRTYNFEPNLNADWNEKIAWSDDSTFIVLTLDDLQRKNNNEKYMQAYDFKDGQTYYDVNFEGAMDYDANTIINIMNSRSVKKKIGK